MNAHFFRIATLGILWLGASMPAPLSSDVSDLQAFTQETRYMSLPGFLRWMYLQKHGRWISRDHINRASPSQGANVGPAPTGVAQ